eukprot:6172367-Pleurochrysis_carterae.AAC.4
MPEGQGDGAGNNAKRKKGKPKGREGFEKELQNMNGTCPVHPRRLAAQTTADPPCFHAAHA